MQVHNRDMFPIDDVIALYRSVEPIVVNAHVDDRFLHYEAAAKSAKRLYHRLGRSGLLLVLLSTIFTVAEALVIPVSFGPRILGLSALALGAVGLGIQIYLLGTKKKQRWLLNRFAAERLRSIKFQAYPLARVAASTADLKQKADAFYAIEVSRLEMELNAADAALVLFSPAKAIVQPVAPAAPAPDAALEAIAQTAYQALRIDYQRRFAAGEVQKLQRQQRIGYAPADFLYLSGAALMVAALACKTVFQSAETTIHWIDFLAVLAFILALSKNLMDNASLADISKTRYEDYVRALDECEDELRAENASFPEAVRRIERVVLGELGEFCQGASYINYRL